ncbi:MAG: endonuclease III, partial [Barnesiella sp.]|nr:endonuclease III [Barnesiella sp.]
MTVAQRYAGVIDWFEHNMPEPRTELHYQSPFQLLVAVILSAQCTDKRINMVTPPLFEAFPTPQALAAASEEEVFELIRSVSYPNNKTRSLIGMARKLVEDFGGEVPSDIDSLLTIPGVGRKT